MEEEAVPVRDEVRGAWSLLGLDPLHIANEGQLVASSRRTSRLGAETLRDAPGWRGGGARRPGSTLPRRGPCSRVAAYGARALSTCWSADPCRGLLNVRS